MMMRAVRRRAKNETAVIMAFVLASFFSGALIIRRFFSCKIGKAIASDKSEVSPNLIVTLFCASLFLRSGGTARKKNITRNCAKSRFFFILVVL